MTSNESVVHCQRLIAQGKRRKRRVLGDSGNILPARTGVKKPKVEVNIKRPKSLSPVVSARSKVAWGITTKPKDPF